MFQLQETKTYYCLKLYPCVSYKKGFGDETLLNREYIVDRDYTVDREYNYLSEYISTSEEIEFIWDNEYLFLYISIDAPRRDMEAKFYWMESIYISLCASIWSK